MSRLVRILQLLAVLILAPMPAVGEDWAQALTGPASRLWTALPEGGRLALRPLDSDDSGLPESLLIEVERALAAALLDSAPPGGAVLARRDLEAIWEEVASFDHGPPSGALSAAAVDALVTPVVSEQPDGISVSAAALGLRDGALGKVLAVMPPVRLAGALGQAGTVRAETGARRLGVTLAEGLRVVIDPGAAFAVRIKRRGPRGPAADWFAGLVEAHLIRRLAARPLYVARPFSRFDHSPERRAVSLELDLWDQGGRLDVQARAVMGEAEARGMARISLASVPRGFLPLTRDGGRVGAGLYRATGSFAPVQTTDPREVRFAARVLARAALIEEGLGRDGGRRQGARLRDIEVAMRSIARAVPYEEIWRDRSAEGGGSVQGLAARLSPVGGSDAPRLDAAVERALYRPGDLLSARVLLHDGRAFLAAYAWQADDTVVRIAPRDAAARSLDAEIRADLPGPGDDRMTAAPLPGSRESVEAIVVVASAVPFSAAALAPLAGTTAQGSLAAATQMSAFLDRLAALDLKRVSLAVLPYRTRAGD